MRLRSLGARKTVCIDCRYLGPRPSGIAETVRALVDFVPGMAPDLDFLLLRSPAQREPLSAAGNVREVIVPQAANGPATMWWLSHVVDLAGIDLFHAPFNIMPARLPAPCITTIHDLMWLTHPHWCDRRLSGRLRGIFHGHGIKRALQASAAITTVSTASRDRIVERAPQMAARTFVTLSGVSPDFRPVASNPARLVELGLMPDRRFVLTVGQNAPYKNHEGALLAFAFAFAARAEIDLVLVQRRDGEGERLRRLAAALGIGNRVHFLGTVARDDLVLLYSMAAALLHPSHCEGFGNPLAEAMACGCPVVTSDCSAMPEVTAGAALLAPPDDPSRIANLLKTVVDNERHAVAMRRAGLARAAELCWRGFAESNLAIYRRVLAPS